MTWPGIGGSVGLVRFGLVWARGGVIGKRTVKCEVDSPARLTKKMTKLIKPIKMRATIRDLVSVYQAQTGSTRQVAQNAIRQLYPNYFASPSANEIVSGH